MRKHLGEDFYMVWFQEPGVAEAALEADVRRTLATSRVWTAAWAAEPDEQPPTPSFLSEDELQVYIDAFTRTGFHGGLSYYRNLDRNWERTAPFAERRITQPVPLVAIHSTSSRRDGGGLVGSLPGRSATGNRAWSARR